MYRLLKKRLHFIEEAVFTVVHRHAALLGKFYEQLFLLCRQFGGNLYFDRIQLIARAAALETGDAESFESKDFVMLRPRRDFENRVAFERGNFDFSPKDGGDEADGYIAHDVIALPLEDRVGFDGNGDVQIAGRAGIGAMLSFIGESEPHSCFNSGRNMNGNRSFFVDTLSAFAGRTRIRDDLSGPFALSTGATDTEKSLLEAELPSTFTAWTGFDGCRRSRSGSFAIKAAFPSWNFELGFFSVDGFFEGNLQIVLQVASTFCSASTAAATGLSEKILEDIVENVAESSSASEVESVKSPGSLLASGMAEGVVAASLLLIAECLVGFVDLFEFFFGGFLLTLAGVQVRMVLSGKAAVCLFEVIVRRILFDAKDLVVIAFVHGNRCSIYLVVPNIADVRSSVRHNIYLRLFLVLIDFFEFRIHDFFIGLSLGLSRIRGAG